MCVVFPQSAAFRQKKKEGTVKPSGTLRVQPKLHRSAIKLTQEANFAEKSHIKSRLIALILSPHADELY